MLLMNIRAFTIKYCAKKKRDNDNEKCNIEKEIERLKILYDNSSNDELGGQIAELEHKLAEIRKIYVKGLMLRTRAKWIEEGEKPTKYFCSLEKRQYINKNVSKLLLSDNKVVTEQTEILNEIKNFYKMLYDSKEHELLNVNLENLLFNCDVPKLSDIESALLEREITLNDLSMALKQMKNDKSPGPDGFSVEFYKMFWKDLGIFYHRSILHAIRRGSLSITQKQGIISILPKGDKPREYLKNWRPISLLNISYKVLSAAIASRIKTVLPKIISENQTGFMKGRFIGENTRMLYDILKYTQDKKIPGLLLLIDFEKAFDSVAWVFVYKTLKFFNFGPNIISLIKLLNEDVKLCVIQRGFFSEFFNIRRGCRQGDPVSPYIFVMCAEILSILFKKDENITGIKIGKSVHKISQYADDTCIYLNGTETSLRNSLNLLDQYAKFSGLKPNIAKTRCIWIGSNIGQNVKLCNDFNLNWDQGPFNVLGIHFSNVIEEIPSMNIEPKLEEINRCIALWSKRNISVIGKIVVVKTILLSKMVHLFTSLPIKPDYVKKIQKLLYGYIWSKKPDRIARNTLIQEYCNGGLKMIDISAYIKSLKVSWIQRSLTSSGPWVEILHEIVPKYETDFFKVGVEYIKRVNSVIENEFWKEVLLSIYDLYDIIKTNNRLDLQSPIWYNPHIRINRTTLAYPGWINKGVYNISDVMDSNYVFLSYERFCQKYDFTPPVTLYHGLILTLKKLAITLEPMLLPHIPEYLQVILSNKKGSISVYTKFREPYKRPKSEAKWEKRWENFVIDWNETYKRMIYFCKDPTKKWFHYRILHDILGTNDLLFKMGIKDSPLCSFCNKHNETIYHLFCECEKVKQFWADTQNWINSTLKSNTIMVNDKIILGFQPVFSYVLNEYIILTRFHIYQQKMRNQQPSIELLKVQFKTLFETEEIMSVRDSAPGAFRKRWLPFLKLFE